MKQHPIIKISVIIKISINTDFLWLEEGVHKNHGKLQILRSISGIV